MIYAAILAGGLGKRMNSAIPKQFLPLGGSPIFIHSIRRFLQQEEIAQVYLGIPADWVDVAQEQITKYLGDEPRFHTALGGENREDTLMNIIGKIKADYGVGDADIILVHDSVRPFVTPRLLRAVMEKMCVCKACNTVVPAVNTIVRSQDGIEIDDVPLRSHMYAGQSPQGFHIKTLLEAYASLSAEEKQTLTETTRICMMRGIPVHFVQGEVFNFKITTEYDYQMAQNMFAYIREVSGT